MIPPPGPRPADRAAWIVAGLLGLHFLWLAPRLWYPDLVLDYPFLGGDSQDWIAAGFRLAGYDVASSARPPLLPLAIAALERLRALGWLPILLQALVHAGSFALYSLLRHDHPAAVAAPVALAWHFNFTFSSLSLEIMADVPGACLLGLGAYLVRHGDASPACWAGAGLLFGLGGLTQPAVLLVLPVWIGAVLLRRRAALRAPWLWLAMALGMAPTLLSYLLRLLGAGTADAAFSRHWELLRLHGDGLPFYPWAWASFLGLPAAVLALAGAWTMARHRGAEPWAVFALGSLATLGAFFTFVYDFEAQRFLALVFGLSAVPAADALSRLPRRAFVPALALVAAGSLLPRAGQGNDPRQVALWPLPPTFLAAKATPTGEGSLAVDPTELAIAVRPIRELWTRSVQRRVLVASRESHPPPTLRPIDFADDVAALFLFDDARDGSRRYAITGRLGNLLGKKVFFLPYSEIGTVVAELDLERVGQLDGKRIYRAGLRGLDGRWLVIAAARGEADRALARRLRAPPTGERPAIPGLDLAHRVAARLGRDVPVVFSDDRVRRGWQLYLPFVVGTPELLLVPPEQASDARRLLDSGQVLGRETEDGVAITRVRFFGRVWAVIEEDES